MVEAPTSIQEPEQLQRIVKVSARVPDRPAEVTSAQVVAKTPDALSEQQPVVAPPNLVVVPDIDSVTETESIAEPEPETKLEPESAQEPQAKPYVSQAPATGSATTGRTSTEVPMDLQSSEDWIAIFQQLPLEGMLKSICGQLSFRTREANFLTFDIDQAASGVLSDKYQAKFCDLLGQFLGQNIELKIESKTNSNESPSSRAQRLHSEALEAAENELLESEAAKKLSETFGATLVPGSVNLK